jgi:hypothetical protein
VTWSIADVLVLFAALVGPILVAWLVLARHGRSGEAPSRDKPAGPGSARRNPGKPAR